MDGDLIKIENIMRRPIKIGLLSLLAGWYPGLVNSAFAVDTDGSGLFQFTGLLMGPYRVFAFSDCENCQSGTEEKDASVTISTNGEAVDVGTITIEKR